MLSLISNIRTTRIKSNNQAGFKTVLDNPSTEEILPNQHTKNFIFSKNWLEMYR